MNPPRCCDCADYSTGIASECDELRQQIHVTNAVRILPRWAQRGFARADSPGVSSRLRRHHLGEAAHARVAPIPVVLPVHAPVAGFDELTGPDPHAVANRTEDRAIPAQPQELAILTAGHPWLAVPVKVESTHEVSHLHRLEEPAVARIDDDAIFLPVADPDIAVGRIDGEPMGRTDFSLSHFVAVPFIDECAVLIE